MVRRRDLVPSLVHLHYLVRRDRSLGAPWHQPFRHGLEVSLAERAAMRRHHYLVASSPLIADSLKQSAPLAHVVHAPLSLDPQYYTPAPLDGPPVAGIIGTADWPPTAAAMRELVDTVWPEVMRRAPAARLVVAGRGTEKLGLSPASGIECLGEVPSGAAFLRGLSLLLFPLRRGSGMKVKVLEALAVGLPIVTTTAGAEGIDADPGVVVTDTTTGLVEAASSILLDQQERLERGRSARGLSSAASRRSRRPSRSSPFTTACWTRDEHSLFAHVGRPVGNPVPIDDARIVVVSPHLDDAVLSLGAALSHAVRRGADVTVLTVLAGDPRVLVACVLVGCAGRLPNSRRRRHRAAARGRAGVFDPPLTPRWLPFSDSLHGPVPEEEVVVALRTELQGFDLILLPGFPLAHPDHGLLNRLVLEQLQPKARMLLYAEQPYYLGRALALLPAGSRRRRLAGPHEEATGMPRVLVAARAPGRPPSLRPPCAFRGRTRRRAHPLERIQSESRSGTTRSFSASASRLARSSDGGLTCTSR